MAKEKRGQARLRSFLAPLEPVPLFPHRRSVCDTTLALLPASPRICVKIEFHLVHPVIPSKEYSYYSERKIGDIFSRPWRDFNLCGT